MFYDHTNSVNYYKIFLQVYISLAYLWVFEFDGAQILAFLKLALQIVWIFCQVLKTNLGPILLVDLEILNVSSYGENNLHMRRQENF